MNKKPSKLSKSGAAPPNPFLPLSSKLCMIPAEVQSLFDRLRPIFGDQVESLRTEYQLNPRSRAEIEVLLQKLIKDRFGTSDPLVLPEKGKVVGPYSLGDVILGKEVWDVFGLNEAEWIQHLGILGRSGGGKTNIAFLILARLAEKGKPFLVFDWKRNYRDLLQRDEFSDLKVLTIGRKIAPFHFNPLIPPADTEPEIFLKKLIEIMMHVYFLGEGVSYLLQRAIDELYDERGVYSGTCQEFPTMFDVADRLRSYPVKGREAQWMQSAQRAVATLCFAQIGRVLNTNSNAPFERLLQSKVILELDALANSDKTFLVESMLLWLHHMRMRERERETFKHAIIIEEAHHVLLKRLEARESIMDIIFREIRELGESIIFLDQHPSMISIPSLGNSYCTIAMNLKHGSDIAALGKAMMLSDYEKSWLGKLPVGEGIVKLQGRWTRPFHVRFPHFHVVKGGVSDRQLREQFLRDSAELEEYPLPERSRTQIPVLPVPDEVSKEGIGGAEMAFLRDVKEFPTAGINERVRRLNISVRKTYSLLSSLCHKTLISSSTISVPQGRKTVIRITASGKEALGIDGHISDATANESIEHWYWKRVVCEELRNRGVEVDIEKDGADLVATMSGKRIAIEIETGKSDWNANIARNLQNGIDLVLVVWTNRRKFVACDARVRQFYLSNFLTILRSADMFKDLIGNPAAA